MNTGVLLEPLKIIAANLVLWRNAEGLSQTEVAKRAKVSPTYVNQVEKEGNPNPGILQLSRIAAVFGRTLADLVRDPKDAGGHKKMDCLRVVKKILADLEDPAKEAEIAREILGTPEEKS